MAVTLDKVVYEGYDRAAELTVGKYLFNALERLCVLGQAATMSHIKAARLKSAQ